MQPGTSEVELEIVEPVDVEVEAVSPPRLRVDVRLEQPPHAAGCPLGANEACGQQVGDVGLDGCVGGSRRALRQVDGTTGRACPAGPGAGGVVFGG